MTSTPSGRQGTAISEALVGKLACVACGSPVSLPADGASFGTDPPPYALYSGDVPARLFPGELDRVVVG